MLSSNEDALSSDDDQKLTSDDSALNEQVNTEDDVTANGNTAEPLEQISLDDARRSYPPYIFLYIENYVGGNVTGAMGHGASYFYHGGNADPSSTYSNMAGRLESAESFENWFYDTTLDNQIHVLLVAVFAGNTLRFINECRAQIKRRLVNQRNTRDESSLVAGPIRKQTTRMLAETQTVIYENEYTVESGGATVQVVRFANMEIHRAVLDFIRTSLDIEPWLGVFTNLLAQICTMKQRDLHAMGTPLIDLTRSQAAIGLGELAKRDYAYYLSAVIRPWARSRDVFLRFIVGWVLFALATDENHRKAIFSLLAHWGKSENVYLQWTAAATCSRVGLIDINETLSISKFLLEHASSQYTLQALSLSFELLYTNPENARQIINQLAAWITFAHNEDGNNVLISRVPPLFLSLIRLEFSNEPTDVFKNPPMEKKSSASASTSDSVLWYLLEQENDVESRNMVLSNIVFLLKACFMHDSARVVDQTCDIIQTWLIDTAEQPSVSSRLDAIYKILAPLYQERKTSQYLKHIIRDANFMEHPVVVRLERLLG